MRTLPVLWSVIVSGLIVLNCSVTQPADGSVIDLDNADTSGAVQKTGNWTVIQASSGINGSDYLRDDSVPHNGALAVLFTPNLPTEGVYRVYVWYVSGGTKEG